MHLRATLVSTVVFMAVASTPAPAAKLTVSQYGRVVGTLPWAVALEKGMFNEAGLDIDGIIPGSGGGTSMRNLMAGEIPVGEVATAVAVAAAKAGIGLKIIFSASQHIGELAWATKPDSDIKSVMDLVGKKVAFTNPKSTTEMVIRNALKKEGLSDKVEVIPLGGLGPALTALAQGVVAAAPVVDPRLTLQPTAQKILFSASKYYPHFTWQVGVVTQEFADKSPDTIRKIIAVRRKAVEYVYAHPKESAEIYAKVWNVSQQEAEAILPKFHEWKHWGAGDFTAEGLAAVSDSLNLVGEASGPIDWSTLIDQRFLDKDLQRPL